MPTTVVGKTRMPPWYSTCSGVMTGQHTEITLSFMLPRHTKFSPDWCFGLLKKRTKVGGISDLVSVVNQSASVHITHNGGWNTPGYYIKLAKLLFDLHMY